MENSIGGSLLQLTIRKAESREYKTALSLAERSFMAYVGIHHSEEGRQSFLRYADYTSFLARQSSGHESFVALDEKGTIVGMAEVRQRRHISMLFVEPSLVGKGIGRALLEFCLAKCRSYFTRKAITLNASDYAREFYRKMGFMAIGPRKTEDGLSSTPMQRNLTAKLK